jgi:integrase
MAFGKRTQEVVSLRLGDIVFSDTDLSITFTVGKKVVRRKKCLHCMKNMSWKSKFCTQCGTELLLTGTETKPRTARELDLSDPNPPRKRKSIPLRHPAIPYIRVWYDVMKIHAPDCFFFCPNDSRGWDCLDVGNPVISTERGIRRSSVQKIIERYIPKSEFGRSLWPHLWRYACINWIAKELEGTGEDVIGRVCDFMDITPQTAQHYLAWGVEDRNKRLMEKLTDGLVRKMTTTEKKDTAPTPSGPNQGIVDSSKEEPKS